MGAARIKTNSTLSNMDTNIVLQVLALEETSWTPDSGQVLLDVSLGKSSHWAPENGGAFPVGPSAASEPTCLCIEFNE